MSITSDSQASLSIALGNLLNSVLGPRNIRVTITHPDRGINVTLNASQKINQAPAITLIQKALEKLELQESVTVHLQARCLGIPDWQTRVDFAGSHLAPEPPKREIQPFKPTSEKLPLASKSFVNRQSSPSESIVIPAAVKAILMPESHEPASTHPEPDPPPQLPPEDQSLELAPPPSPALSTRPSPKPPKPLAPESTPFITIPAPSPESPDLEPTSLTDPVSQDFHLQVAPEISETSESTATLDESEATATTLRAQIEAKLEEILADQFANFIPTPKDTPESASLDAAPPQSPSENTTPVLEEEPVLDSPGLEHTPPKSPSDLLTADLWNDELPPEPPANISASVNAATPPAMTAPACPEPLPRNPPEQHQPHSDPLPRYTIPKVERVPRDQEAKVVGFAGLVMGVGFCATGLGTVIGLPMVIGGAYMMGDQEVLRGVCPHCGQPLKVTLGKMWRFSCPTCQGLVQIKNGRFYQVL